MTIYGVTLNALNTVWSNNILNLHFTKYNSNSITSKG